MKKYTNITFKDFLNNPKDTIINEGYYIDTHFFTELCDYLERKFHIDVTHPESIELEKIDLVKLRNEANLFADKHHLNDATEEELVKILDTDTAHDFMIRLLGNLS
jgi:hypothetical protein